VVIGTARGGSRGAHAPFWLFKEKEKKMNGSETILLYKIIILELLIF